jgi:hypothetical protein
MMWQEFEKLAGYEVSYEDYSEIIEPMYIATDLSKADFIATLNRERFEKESAEKKQKRLIKRMKMLAAEIKGLLPGTGAFYAKEQELDDLADEIAKAFGCTCGWVSEFRDTWSGYWFPAFIKFNCNKLGVQYQIDCKTGKIERW